MVGCTEKIWFSLLHSRTSKQSKNYFTAHESTDLHRWTVNGWFHGLRYAHSGNINKLSIIYDAFQMRPIALLPILNYFIIDWMWLWELGIHSTLIMIHRARDEYPCTQSYCFQIYSLFIDTWILGVSYGFYTCGLLLLYAFRISLMRNCHWPYHQ